MVNKTLFWSFYVSFCTFYASLRLIRTVFTRLKTCLPHEIAQRYLFGVISASKNLCNLLLKICAICGKNLRNLRLINDLRTCLAPFSLFPSPFSLLRSRMLYNCREDSTTIESSLQIKLFMQNKAKSKKVKLNVSPVNTRNYGQMDTWSIRKKQSQTNPNKPKLKKAEMNVTSAITKAYENKPPIWAPKKQSQISKRQKPMQTYLPQRIMKKPPLRATKKQTQFKPKQTQFQSQYMLLLLTINGCRISFDHYAGNRQTIPTGSPDTPRLLLRRESFLQHQLYPQDKLRQTNYLGCVAL